MLAATDEDRTLVLELALGRVSMEEFRARYRSVPPESVSSKLALLQDAAQSARGADVECAMLLCTLFGGFTTEHVGILCELLLSRSHSRHEDVALALEDLRDERSVEALYHGALMKHEYLSHDDSHALARKCTWALARIGTPTARAKLEALGKCGDAVVEGYADKRLRDWRA